MWSTLVRYAALCGLKPRPILRRSGHTSLEIAAASDLAPETVELVLSFIASGCKGPDLELASVERVLFATRSPAIELI